ncbi:MAG TPA: hypothetical protein VFF33_07140 [Ignavibacteriaceae bacterium]|nr:hypothetical protein [Ignavibacteriaceae bacterium]
MKLINLIINSLYKTLFIVFIILSFYPTTAQDSGFVLKDSTQDSNKIELNKEKNIIFLELAGNGLAFSINYERFISKVLSLRIGIGTAGMILKCYPFLINYNFENAPIELGLGIVPYSHGYWHNVPETVTSLKYLLTSTIGFKRINKNFMFKATFNPYFSTENKRFTFYAGLSIGIAF